MCSRTRTRVCSGDWEGKQYMNDDGAFEDVHLVVEGKKIRANSSILAYNSSVLSQMIKESRARKVAYNCDDDFADIEGMPPHFPLPDETNGEKTRVVLSNQKYKNVKSMVRYLEAKKEKQSPLTGEAALELLPLTEEYKMIHFQRQCRNAIYNSLTDMRMEHRLGCIPTLVILKYLAAADKYNFDKIRTFCIDECAASFSLTRRKEIAEDKHIAERTKVTIMDKMCDNMSKTYEQNLKQIRADMDRRCREIEKKRDEFMELTESWKADLKQEAEDIAAANKQAHQKLVDDLEQKKIIERIDKTVKQNSENILFEMNYLKEQIDTVVETMETKELLDEAEANALRETIAIANESNMENVQQIASTFKGSLKSVLKCCENENLEMSLSENYELHERFDKVSAEMDVKIQALSDASIKYEEEKLEHARTKVELRKQMKKCHKVNTWVKWAKPAEDDENKCVCFRHHCFRKGHNY